MFTKSEFFMEWMDKYKAPTGYEHEIVMTLDSGDHVKLIAKFLAYEKKEDFLFALCHNSKQDDNITGVYENLRLDERADYDIELVEVSWRYECETLHQLQLSMRDRVLILRRFMPFVKSFLADGYGGPTPHENIMVVALPRGFKVLDNLGGVSAEQGQRQRSLFAKRMGMGSMKDCDWSFAKYGADLKLHPL
jgi:hypothetical protein|tara:strand:- start:546 stop:1121 length:576 start_codon:yes stop_codon:yes gene_type:complete